MNVLHFNLQNKWRGGEQQLALLMKYAQKNNKPQTLVCLKNSDLEAWAIKENIAYIPIKKGFFLNLQQFLKIKEYIKNQKVAIIHCGESRGLSFLVYGKLLFGLNTPIVFHRQVMFPIKGWFSKNIKYSNKIVSKVICISKAVQKVFEQTTSNTNTTLIPSMTEIDVDFSTDFSIREKLKLANHTKIVGYIAALTFEKDHLTFLKTAKIILETNPNTAFVLIGDGPLRPELEKEVETLGIHKNVYFFGFVDNAKRLIPQIDVLLFTSKSEGLGGTILDFFIAKRPVVTVKNGGSEDLVLNGKTGFICEIGDADALATHTLDFLNNEELTKEITKNSYDFVVKNFTVETVCKKIYDVYDSILKAS